MAEISEYPFDPPPCQTGNTVGVPCEGCPRLPDCRFLAVGNRILSTSAMLEITQDALQEAQRENEESRFDNVIPGFLTWRGVKHLINQDAKLRRELQAGEWGLLFCDVRGLKSTNDAYGLSKGDNLLKLAGTRLITEAGIRQRHKSVPVNQRRVENGVKDLGIRNRSSDELVVVTRRVAFNDFMDVVLPRQVNRFSPQRAMADSRAGLVPTILGCAGVHASEIDADLLTYPYDALRSSFNLADKRQRNGKPAQYDEMFRLAIEAALAKGVTLAPQGDERGKAGLFLEWCCPDYSANAEQLLANDDII